MARFSRPGLFALLIPAGILSSAWAGPLLRVQPPDQHKWQLDAIASLPVPSSDRIWVKVREPLSLESLSSFLRLPEDVLAKLNDVPLGHVFLPGNWLVVPSIQTRQMKQLAAVDTSELRRTPPLESSPPLEERGIVRFGDTLLKLAQRYGLTLQELLRLNPGLEGARLVAGTQIQLVQSAPGRSRMVLGLKPTTSGGASWPELPGFGSSSTNSGISSIGLVGPFKRTPTAFARYLNSQPTAWQDPSLRTYFYDLYNCYSFPGDISNTMPPSYRCNGGYLSLSDNLGSRRCRLDYVSWSWATGQQFKALACR